VDRVRLLDELRRVRRFAAVATEKPAAEIRLVADLVNGPDTVGRHIRGNRRGMGARSISIAGSAPLRRRVRLKHQ
jgi:hypothetical protein